MRWKAHVRRAKFPAFPITNQTWGTLTNSDHTEWALFPLKFYVPLTIYQSGYPTPLPLGIKIWRLVRRAWCLTCASAHVCRAEFWILRAFSAHNSNLGAVHVITKNVVGTKAISAGVHSVLLATISDISFTLKDTMLNDVLCYLSTNRNTSSHSSLTLLVTAFHKKDAIKTA